MLLKDNVISAGKDEICQAVTWNDLFFPSLPEQSRYISVTRIFLPSSPDRTTWSSRNSNCSFVLHRNQESLTCDSVFAAGPGVGSRQPDLISYTLRTFLLLPLLSLCLAPGPLHSFFFFFLNIGQCRDPERKAPAFKELRGHVEESVPRKQCRVKI